MSDIPVDIGRDQARDAALRELSDPAYRDAEPSWFTQAVRWVLQRLSDLFDSVGSVVPGGLWSIVALMVVLLGIAIGVRLKVGKLARTTSATVFGDRVLTAADHRRAAETAAAQGDLAEAVRERFRAIVRGLEERHVLDPRSGRTVDEAASEAGRWLPEHADALRASARLFDDVWYGGHPATAAGYQSLVDLDLALDGARR
ncbi:hypothetical protein JOF56_008021 [Kibdelosporangium banguiense]|uniref:Protein-glutamine gamma-glutamyltransferase-like C-terminal domain-containing protein n=1 Tax=Kibdelosporangium banguiense TaxID=1365924 RepID=A0ABS4TT98_9PSEU|nr:DUF4129 domain-containing protein [Kibdelosporangium banguiense]MBP2327636.1 hypothetical protein [Kibdelosporangium banguiense]